MEIKSFLGIRNTSPARSIPDNALTDASNVDIDDVGIVTRRNGSALVKALSNVTSAYSTAGQSGYVVSNGVLYRVLPDLTTISLGATSAKQFCDFAEVVFTNDGLKIDNDIVTDLKLPSPVLPLDLSIISGSMPAGTYSATYCYRSVTGLESGSAPIVTIELETEGGISIAPITPPAGYTVTIYMTDANGTTYYDNNGVQLSGVQTLSESFPDDIDKLAYHENRLWLSKSLSNGSSIIWFSHPFHYHLYDVAKNYIIVPGQIHAMMATEQGLLIGTDSAIYAYSDQLVKLAAYGAVAGRPFTKLANGQVMVWTQRGMCVALPFQNLSEAKVSFAPGVQCSTALVQQDGINKFVTVTDGSGTAYNARN